jgi:hypothetical protein
LSGIGKTRDQPAGIESDAGWPLETALHDFYRAMTRDPRRAGRETIPMISLRPCMRPASSSPMTAAEPVSGSTLDPRKRSSAVSAPAPHRSRRTLDTVESGTAAVLVRARTPRARPPAQVPSRSSTRTGRERAAHPRHSRSSTIRADHPGDRQELRLDTSCPDPRHHAETAMTKYVHVLTSDTIGRRSAFLARRTP